MEELDDLEDRIGKGPTRVLDYLRPRRGRMVPVHEIAVDLNKPPRKIWRWLRRLSDEGYAGVGLTAMGEDAAEN